VAAGRARITFHDLRHSYATGALKAGVIPKILSERIGHADVGFFLQTYAHVIKNGPGSRTPARIPGRRRLAD
jgi:integrase